MSAVDRTDQQKPYDFLIVGSGFAGSITAMALAKSGFKVCLIERGKHPRFTIGESSTPIADMILRDLAEDYDLPFLKKLSRYGEWQKNYPEIVCGLKRGFSYYHHQKGKPFESDEFHAHELLVAASENDQNSDTNWLRSDVDHFLVEKVKASQVDYLDQCKIETVVRNKDEELWTIGVKKNQDLSTLNTSWIIDATGSSAFSEKFLGTRSSSDGFETHSSAIYSHFEGVDYWSSYLENRSFHTADYPYKPDYSALHHIIDEGWMWMLRFNNGLLSAGLMFDDSVNDFTTGTPEKLWNRVKVSYPSIKTIFEKGQYAKVPGQIFKTGRLQRKLNKMYGDGWLTLNHTAGFVDPLHSTGIAHTLTGVEKILNVFSKIEKNGIEKHLQKIEIEFNKELSVIDIMVSSCYLSRSCPALFNAVVMLYFIASIRYEQERLAGRIPDTFLCAGDPVLSKLIVQTHSEVKMLMKKDLSSKQVRGLIQKIKSRIKPYNPVGLMNLSNNNMYFHTAVKL